MIMDSTNFNINSIDDQLKLQLCVNIWPKGRGILHKLALGGANENSQTREVDQMQAFLATKELFQTCKKKLELGLVGHDNSQEQKCLEIPILPDMYGADPIEICFGQNKKREAGLFVFYEDEFNRRITEQTENLAMAEVIFSYIKDYGLMSSSMFIN